MVAPDFILTELQLISLDFNEHTIGNLIVAVESKVHSDECVDPFKGQISSIVNSPLKLNVNSSNSGSGDGREVALTELSTLQVLPMTLILLPNILVLFEIMASCEMMTYVEFSPYICLSLPFSICTSILDV